MIDKIVSILPERRSLVRIKGKMKKKKEVEEEEEK